MAARRKVRRTGLKRRRDSFGVLLRRGEAEVAKLLQSNRAGTITRDKLNDGLKELDTGLREVEARLKKMLNHVIDIL